MTTSAPYIEAFGSPAVGKSYVTHRLVMSPLLRQAPVLTEAFPLAGSRRVGRVTRKLCLSLRYLPSLLSRADGLVSLVRRTPWMSAAGAVRALANWVQLLAMIQHLHRKRAPILLCQGIFQAVWSLRFRAEPPAGRGFPMREWIEFSLSLMPSRPIVVLHVVAAPAVIRRRQAERTDGQSVMDRSGHEQEAASQRSAHIVQEILAELLSLEAEGRLRIVTFRNDAAEMAPDRLSSLAVELGLDEGKPGAAVNEGAAGLPTAP
ncbi:hypothetical protein [Halomonas heilongjiangensis]|uniref:Uncharacterized protein n=1 Tax=Halomonas heilongjiangensis TaxID=1387883 RepID=A0A2N7TUK1_9GAMM|nr:hypothetical protein [Halomonas heilongjiangensis]PMR71864.1 hypothetical protein C1H66_01075 [Halomonas heilongjiangensis]PXX87673.1 hypothetical protein CR158_17880 [Halomonas heilongjiangensis]